MHICKNLRSNDAFLHLKSNFSNFLTCLTTVSPYRLRNTLMIEKFHLYLNCQHANIKFTSKIEENNSISFLDIKINRDSNRFLTSVYRKPTFSGVFTNFDSYIPLSYKSGLISSLLYRAFKLCSNFEIFHQEIIFLKDIFKRNGYPSNFIDNCVKTFSDKIFIEKKAFSVAQKKE